MYVFLLPTIALYGLFTVYPIIGSYWYSFLDWNGFEAVKTFVGLANYREALARHRRDRDAVRLRPRQRSDPRGVEHHGQHERADHLHRDGHHGEQDRHLALLKLGVIDEGINFLGDSDTALWTVVAVFTWKWLGQTLIYWLAALQTIPRETYEAASIDGAGSLRMTRFITLPLLKPFLIIITLLTLESTLQVFDLMLTMTGGGPFSPPR